MKIVMAIVSATLGALGNNAM
ncbi:DUF6486 family protein [Bacteroides timonensis]|nr:DUF6486 family protein [Bacteroides timonensis]